MAIIIITPEEKIKYDTNKTYLVKDNKIFKIKLDTYGIVGNSKVVDLELEDQELPNMLKNLEISAKSVYTKYYRDTLKIIYNPKQVEVL